MTCFRRWAASSEPRRAAPEGRACDRRVGVLVWWAQRVTAVSACWSGGRSVLVCSRGLSRRTDRRAMPAPCPVPASLPPPSIGRDPPPRPPPPLVGRATGCRTGGRPRTSSSNLLGGCFAPLPNWTAAGAEGRSAGTPVGLASVIRASPLAEWPVLPAAALPRVVRAAPFPDCHLAARAPAVSPSNPRLASKASVAPTSVEPVFNWALPRLHSAASSSKRRLVSDAPVARRSTHCNQTSSRRA